jgi:exportin-7
MKFWARSEVVISKTLQLFSDLSVGYSSARKLVKLESVQLLLNNHTVSINKTRQAGRQTDTGSS